MTRNQKYTDHVSDIDLDQEDVRLKDGTRLTEDRAKQLGQEIAERGRKAGRPSLSGGAKRSPQLGIRLPEELDAKLRAKADAEGKRVSDAVREAIEAYVS